MAGITLIPGGVSVQRGAANVDFSVGGASPYEALDVTISAVDTSKAVAFVGIRNYTHATEGKPFSSFKGEIINATTLRIHVVCGDSTAETVPVVWQVAEFS